MDGWLLTAVAVLTPIAAVALIYVALPVFERIRSRSRRKQPFL
jgi:hypothetical protein